MTVLSSRGVVKFAAALLVALGFASAASAAPPPGMRWSDHAGLNPSAVRPGRVPASTPRYSAAVPAAPVGAPLVTYHPWPGTPSPTAAYRTYPTYQYYPAYSVTYPSYPTVYQTYPAYPVYSPYSAYPTYQSYAVVPALTGR
jgi:hypothetical protein